MTTTEVTPAVAGGDDVPSAVRWEQQGAVGHLVLNRPEKLNAIDRTVLTGIHRAMDRAEGDPSIRAVVLSGAGRAFSAGGDLDEVAGLVRDTPAFDAFLDHWHATLLRVERSPLPVLAAVHGVAFAGGFELTQVCDVVVVGDRTQLGDQHATYGLFPAGGSTQRLPRLTGGRLARWMLMSGTVVEPARALAAGLVTEVVAEEDVLRRTQEMAALLAARSPAGTTAIKQAIALGAGMTIEAAIAAERPVALAHMASDDVQTGLAAFRRREAPAFADRSPIEPKENGEAAD